MILPINQSVVSIEAHDAGSINMVHNRWKMPKLSKDMQKNQKKKQEAIMERKIYITETERTNEGG